MRSGNHSFGEMRGKERVLQPVSQFHNHAQWLKVKNSGGPLDSQTWHTNGWPQQKLPIQSLVFVLTQLHLGQWSSCPPSFNVQWPARRFHFYHFLSNSFFSQLKSIQIRFSFGLIPNKHALHISFGFGSIPTGELYSTIQCTSKYTFWSSSMMFGHDYKLVIRSPNE